jgi:hypothetical protein
MVEVEVPTGWERVKVDGFPFEMNIPEDYSNSNGPGALGKQAYYEALSDQGSDYKNEPVVHFQSAVRYDRNPDFDTEVNQTLSLCSKDGVACNDISVDVPGATRLRASVLSFSDGQNSLRVWVDVGDGDTKSIAISALNNTVITADQLQQFLATMQLAKA